MRNQKRRSVENNKGGSQNLNANDFISRLPNELLVVILSLLPMKEAVMTSFLSTSWRSLWRFLISLNFDGSQTFIYEEDWACFFYSEQKSYINRVNNVIERFDNPIVKEFRISFGLDNRSSEVINEWIQFAVTKKVEFLELNLDLNVCRKVFEPSLTVPYDFPSNLLQTNLLISNTTRMEPVSLKKLMLSNVNVSDTILQELLQNTPHLETLSISNSGSLRDILVGGGARNLKSFEIAQCYGVKLIDLSDFGLSSFTYKGESTDVRLINLPQLKQVEVDQTDVKFKDSMLGMISSIASSLHSLFINVYRSKESSTLGSVPVLPNLKKLRLTIGGRKSTCLRDLATIVNACPNLETFTIELYFYAPYNSKLGARHVATRTHEHLKYVEIVGYYGRGCDFELAKYIIQTAIVLKKLVIDPDFKTWKRMEAVRSSFTCKLKSVLRDGVELVVR